MTNGYFFSSSFSVLFVFEDYSFLFVLGVITRSASGRRALDAGRWALGARRWALKTLFKALVRDRLDPLNFQDFCDTRL